MIGISDTNAPNMEKILHGFEIAGKRLSFETGKLGLLANGSVTMRDENGNVLFTTAGVKEV